VQVRTLGAPRLERRLRAVARASVLARPAVNAVHDVLRSQARTGLTKCAL
jgi:hypothetical protein